MMKDEYKYSDITQKIIGCAMKVHNTMGNGFQEKIYQRALAIEMGMHLFYDGIHIGTRRVDFVVEGKIMLELKTVTQLENEHLAQALNDLEANKMEIGLLINFVNNKLESSNNT